MQKYNDFRDFIPHIGVPKHLQDEIIDRIIEGHRNKDIHSLSKDIILQEINKIKQSYINYIDFVSECLNKNYEIYEGKYVAKVNYGYNGIVTGRAYFINIHGNKVEFYADASYEHLIPQSLPFDDIDIIKEPTPEDIDKAKENGRNSYYGYFHHFPEQEDVQ